MSGPFSSLSVPASGMTTMKTWIDAIAHNVANMNNISSTDEPGFQSRSVVAQSIPASEGGAVGAGVRVAAVRATDEPGDIVYMPDHPLADENGMVRMPDIDMAEQMSALIIAQRAYAANAAVVDRARETYLAGLQIGRS